MKVANRTPAFVLLLVLSTLVFLFCSPGPDYEHYSEWTEALRHGTAASLSSQTLSPSGMPMSHWGHGTALVLGVFHLLFSSFIDLSASAQLAGVALLLVSSWSLFGIMNALGLENRYQLLVYSLFLGGTNFGYYFIYLASEAVTSAVILFFSWLVFAKKENTLSTALVLGAGMSILLTSRPQIILATLPVLSVFVLREFRNWNHARSLMFFGLAALGLLTGALQVLQVNQWMTGNALHSPLAFGDSTFQSLGEPSLSVAAKVLLSRRVGILIFTPLLALAFFASLAISMRKSLPAEWRLFFGLACLVNAANLAIVSAYYAWSGGWSFGSRYFIPSGLLLFLSLPVVLREIRGRGAAILPIVFLLFAIPTMIALLGGREAMIVGVVSLAAWAVTGPRHAAGGSFATMTAGASASVAISAFCIFTISGEDSFFWKVNPLTALPEWHWAISAVLIFLVALSVNSYAQRQSRPFDLQSARLQVGVTVAGLAIALFQSVKFIEFRSATEEYRSAQVAMPDARFKYRAPFHFENFSDDVDDGRAYYEWSDAELSVLRAFRDSARKSSELEHP